MAVVLDENLPIDLDAMLDDWDGERLKELRERSGLSQVTLAKRAGTSQQNIDRWEKNDRGPAWKHAIRLADALGCSCEDLRQPVGAPVHRRPVRTHEKPDEE